jgi:hypothetical protein
MSIRVSSFITNIPCPPTPESGNFVPWTLEGFAIACQLSQSIDPLEPHSRRCLSTRPGRLPAARYGSNEYSTITLLVVGRWTTFICIWLPLLGWRSFSLSFSLSVSLSLSLSLSLCVCVCVHAHDCVSVSLSFCMCLCRFTSLPCASR